MHSTIETSLHPCCRFRVEPQARPRRDTENVKPAIKRFGIKYPMARDNRYATWSAYNNQYWPAAYLIDKKGQVVYSDFGEGD